MRKCCRCWTSDASDCGGSVVYRWITPTRFDHHRSGCPSYPPRGMTKSAAIDLGGRKIRENSVHTGPIDTDMIAFRTPEQREERMKQVPMHRYGTPEEVAQLVAFLLSDESSYIAGAEIAIDGAASA